jgi:hypothetical protein
MGVFKNKRGTVALALKRRNLHALYYVRGPKLSSAGMELKAACVTDIFRGQYETIRLSRDINVL